MSTDYGKTIICLAISRKNSGRCIAGKEIIGNVVGDWIRPVSGRGTGELSDREALFPDGNYPTLGDVVAIRMKAPQSHEYQPENHIINSGYYWELIRPGTMEEVYAAIDAVQGPLWVNNSSYNGLNDRVPIADAASLGSSLKLIAVSDFAICVAVEGAEFGNGRRKLRGKFSLNGLNYWLAVTDPDIENQYLAGGDGTFPVGLAILCVSLGEPYQGYAYKLIAGVIVLPQS